MDHHLLVTGRRSFTPTALYETFPFFLLRKHEETATTIPLLYPGHVVAFHRSSSACTHGDPAGLLAPVISPGLFYD